MFLFNKMKKKADVLQLNLSTHEALIGMGFELKAYVGERLVGKAHGEFETGKDFRLTKIDVDPTGEGYGTKMIDKLVAAARLEKCAHFTFVGVNSSNTEAIKLYMRYNAKIQASQGSKNDYKFPL